MADKIELAAEVRTTIGTGVRALRRSGKVPAIVYGRHVEPMSIQMDTREVTTTLRKAGRNTLINLNVNGAPKMVLTREVQRDPVRRNILHIDFLEVSMTEKITSTLRIITEGQPEDVKSGAGVLLQERDSINIEALPGDLIESITINVADMKIDDVICVKDLVVPPGIVFLEELEEDIVRLTRFVEAKVEEVVVVETTEVEVIEKGKKEEEEAEEKK